MKFEILSPYRLRIFMTEEDVEEWSLFDKEKVPTVSRNNHIFKKFLRYINLQTGFNAEKTNVLMEAFPKKSGEVELSITKVDNYSEFKILKELLGYGDESSLYTYNSSEIPESCSFVLEFKTLSDFFLLCDSEKQNEKISHTTLYLLDGKYYLYTITENEQLREELETSFLEFGRVCPSPFLARLTEYGKVIKDEDAIAFFASFA